MKHILYTYMIFIFSINHPMDTITNANEYPYIERVKLWNYVNGEKNELAALLYIECYPKGLCCLLSTQVNSKLEQQFAEKYPFIDLQKRVTQDALSIMQKKNYTTMLVCSCKKKHAIDLTVDMDPKAFDIIYDEILGHTCSKSSKHNLLSQSKS